MLKAVKSVLFDILSMILTFILCVFSTVIVVSLFPDSLLFPAGVFGLIGSYWLGDHLVDKLR
ncbi:hypothetical protein [Pectobacterium punjabense]|uniref:hypothetical protein n=1 Tax=Pectobacterium punjabense TaxID=2108399 RepID=UPI000D16E26C|nr:hypothetical protein [Pectobacterium punjabense]MCE9732059.1 hypothetical protein [Pectobacterium sp. IFB5596]GKW13817.1 hypothetical protein PEC301899_40990 [Pectobacterium carotovorum subsp. carotovorum]MBN3136177.1 hypothetical protein [Pectobacterium punjabense]MCE5381865.1 hypothetical protein [Pectobacterium punjabense]MDG0797557.1 hypothetical protein [Pectobacterium punjabense]